MCLATWYTISMRKQDIVIIRSARRTLSLSVNAQGQIVVRAPEKMQTREIERFVSEHDAWIARRRAELALTRPDMSDGAQLQICGTNYTIVPGVRARIVGNTVVLPEERRKEALAALLRRMARVRMTAYLEEYAARRGFSFRAVRITSAKSRWGSCSAEGTISFSYRTALLSEEEARYIAVHELCHTRHMDHSAAFWKEVAAILPGYAAIRRGLRKKSGVMLFF